MARSPILPPGKIRGRTTKESVVKASREPLMGRTAPSWPLFEHGIAERGQKHFFDELMGQPSTTAVRQNDAIVSDSGHWATQTERVHGFGVCHSGNRLHMRPRT